MNLFNVYPLFNITLEKGKDVNVWDDKGQEYLDLYGGHGVISVGHSHPKYVEAIQKQIEKIGFYSNSVQNPLQKELAQKLGQMSGCEDYNLFLCNSGAEANENALKVASFKTGKGRVIAFDKAFHGRTSAAVAATHNPKIQAEINKGHKVTFLPLNDDKALYLELKKGDVAAVIIEGIQGVGGLDEGTSGFFKEVERLTKQYEAILILDEIQSGYGRSGKFFAFQHHDIKPDIITTAKGMANGFPVGGVLIHENIEANFGMLGTTFGGNHLAMSAAISVLDIIKEENLIANAAKKEVEFKELFSKIPEVKQIKGRGLMIGVEFDFPVAELRKKILFDHKMLTGNAANPNLLRILPSLTVKSEHIKLFYNALLASL
ncbi:MAG: aminotransferase class III-fold pyridoxal phosphate-dependent enzyme [Ichthyobacteriaceae bacterium]|nr:aminotransferase class III-fold pyridoxal phosphate-dependent enzyme [Ichthyobacteriaceae bacterium]